MNKRNSKTEAGLSVDTKLEEIAPGVGIPRFRTGTLDDVKVLWRNYSWHVLAWYHWQLHLDWVSPYCRSCNRWFHQVWDSTFSRVHNLQEKMDECRMQIKLNVLYISHIRKNFDDVNDIYLGFWYLRQSCLPPQWVLLSLCCISRHLRWARQQGDYNSLWRLFYLMKDITTLHTLFVAFSAHCSRSSWGRPCRGRRYYGGGCKVIVAISAWKEIYIWMQSQNWFLGKLYDKEWFCQINSVYI